MRLLDDRKSVAADKDLGMALAPPLALTSSPKYSGLKVIALAGMTELVAIVPPMAIAVVKARDLIFTYSGRANFYRANNNYLETVDIFK